MNPSVAASPRRATRPGDSPDASPRDGIDVTLEGVALRRGGRPVLRDLRLRLQSGRRYALLGENGAGKTQFLKLIATDVWPSPGSRGSLRYDSGGHRLEPGEVKRRIAYLGAERQDKYARYGWNLPVRDVIATGLHGTDLLLEPPSEEELGRVERLMRRHGLLRLAARRFLTLSYGEKRLVLLARALIG
ncbi:MAG: ATP-binding cassette domain-containing protein, partial [Gammaproteobacteria bacterium]|nr:ATP-binding cassette domain-containing protein [Gammaproteobacteria bacterium]